MKSFRIAIKHAGHDSTHYVVRDHQDLNLMLEKIRYTLECSDDVELIKFVPIPDLEEVHHAE